jgi:hypothetical protein
VEHACRAGSRTLFALGDERCGSVAMRPQVENGLLRWVRLARYPGGEEAQVLDSKGFPKEYLVNETVLAVHNPVLGRSAYQVRRLLLRCVPPFFGGDMTDNPEERRVLLGQLGRANAFIEFFFEHKTWTLATSLAGVALYFASHSIVTAPKEFGESARNEVRFRGYAQDGEWIQLVIRAVRIAGEGVSEVFSFYQGNVAGKTWLEMNDDKALEDGLIGTQKARRQIALTIGVLSGVRLEDERLDNHRVNFKENLEQVDGFLDILERFYLGYLTKDESTVKQLLPDLRKMSVESEQLAFHMLASAQTFGERAVALTQEQTIEVAEKTSELRIQKATMWLAILAMLYVVGYVIAVVTALIRSLKKTENTIVLS